MGSLAFKDWAAGEGYTKTSPLEQLKNTKVAIDAEDYLSTLLNTSPTREPLLPALGGLPFALEHHVSAYLESLRDASITPIFVFSGLDLACRDRRTVAKECGRAARSLEEAWSLYNRTLAQDAVEEFGKSCAYRTYHILRWLQSYLHHKGVQIQIAPYCAAPQINYLEEHNYAHSVCGSASLLVFGNDRVITSFDWDAKMFNWIDREELLSKARLSQEQLIDVCLFSGSALLPAFPDLDTDNQTSKVQPALNQLRQSNFDVSAVCMRAKEDEYVVLYRKARAAIRHCVILREDGKVEPTNQTTMPGDGHEFLGQQLPPELIGYMSRGVVGPRLLNARARSEVFETPPLDGGNSSVYKELVQDKLAPLKAQSLAVVTQLLHRYYQKNDVELVSWFNEGQRRKLGVPDLSEYTKGADTWNVTESVSITDFQEAATHNPIVYAIEALGDETQAKKTVTPKSQSSPLTKPHELTANVMWRFLHDRGYTNADHTLSARGKALKAALDRAKSDGYLDAHSPEAEEAILMAFELVRLDVLNDKDMFPSPPYSGAPTRGTPVDKQRTLLVSRIACLGNLRHKSIGYTGPLSRHLLAYQQVAAVVRGSLRDLLEAHAAHMLQSGSVSRDMSATAHSDLAYNLPLLREPDLGLSLAVKSYLDELSNDPAKRQDILAWFPQVLDFHGNLRKAWKLWAAVNAGVESAESGVFSAPTKKMFAVTDEWLTQKLANAPVINGSG